MTRESPRRLSVSAAREIVWRPQYLIGARRSHSRRNLGRQKWHDDRVAELFLAIVCAEFLVERTAQAGLVVVAYHSS
jgi:hypothetical protein